MKKYYNSYNLSATVEKSDYEHSNHTILHCFGFASDVAQTPKENAKEIQNIKKEISKIPNEDFEKPTLNNLKLYPELANYSFYVCPINNPENPEAYILKFLEFDFSNFQNYFAFFLEFGFLTIVSSVSQEDLKKFQFLNSISLKQLLNLAHKYYKKDKLKLISFQKEYEKTIQFIFNHDDDKEFKDLSPHNLLIIYELLHSTENTICKYRNNIIITENIMNQELSLHADSVVKAKKNLHQIIKKLSRNKELTLEYGKFYRLSSIFELMYLFLRLLINNNNSYIKKCKCCGKYFYTNKSNVTYCDRIQDTKTNQTCKDIGPDIASLKEKKNNYLINLKASIASKKAMDVKRHPDIPAYKENYNSWKPLATKYLRLYKNGELGENTFEKWLKYSSDEKIKSPLKGIEELKNKED